jgi:hypothetical protein
MKGRIPLLKAAMKLFQELTELPSFGEEEQGFLAVERQLINGVKKVALLTAGMAAQKYGDALIQHEMVLGPIAEIIIQAYAMESAYARAVKLHNAGHRRAEIAAKLTQAYVHQNIGQVELLGRRLMATLSDGDMLQVNLGAVRRFTKHTPIDIVTLKDEVAQQVVDAHGYPLPY